MRHFQDFVSIADKFAEFYSESSLRDYIESMNSAKEDEEMMEAEAPLAARKNVFAS